MPVFTRTMYKTAGLPDLPARFPVDVPTIAPRNPHKTGSAAPKSKPKPVPMSRSTLPRASPVALSSPTRLDAPSPLSSATSKTARNSRASSYSSASTETRIDQLEELHPGLQKARRIPEEHWVFKQEGASVRMCMPPQRGALFGNEWDGVAVKPKQNFAARSPSSEATIRATPVPSANRRTSRASHSSSYSSSQR